VIDIVSVAPALEHAGSQTYRTCNQTAVQGLSVGWGDTYTWNLAGQSLNVSSVRSGTYYLVSTADPGNILLETSDANNTAAVKVQFKGNSAKVIP
jgi:hypothetical protein